MYDNFIREMVIKEKITSIACNNNFYVVVTDNDEVYDWSFWDKKPRKVIELSGKTIGNLFLFKTYYKKK